MCTAHVLGCGTMKALLCLPILFFVGCKPTSQLPASSEAAKGKPRILCANYPLYYFAHRLGGDFVEAVFPAPADEDPAFWQPDDSALSEFQSASLILLNGATYSKWAEKASLPTARTVDTSAAFKQRFIEIKDMTTHSHGASGEHSHGGTAFTTWIDFKQAIEQAEAVRASLTRLLPDQAKAFEDEFHKLQEELTGLDRRLEQVGKRLARAPLVASHPIYQYWARRYDFHVESVLWEPDTVPNEEAMNELQTLLQRHAATWMIWEGEPAAESVAKLEALNVKSVVFDPRGNRPESGDFLSVMRANVEAMEKSFP